jgi:nucleotide-binding universal stress UspA family protein
MISYRDIDEGSRGAGGEALVQKVVVGLDGSEGSRRALDWVLATLAAPALEVVAVHAVRPMGEFLLDLPALGLDKWRQNLAWQLEEVWCRPLREAGVSYRAVTREDNPARALGRVGDDEQADMIVVGAQGHGNVAEELLGSVSYKLAHTAHQAVVVVPADWSARTRTGA